MTMLPGRAPQLPEYIDHCPCCKKLTHYRQRADGSWHCGRCGRDAVQAMPQEEVMATLKRILAESESGDGDGRQGVAVKGES